MKFSDSNRKPRDIRVAIAELSTEEPLPEHTRNRDEKPPYIFSFTKGLDHGQNGLLVDHKDFEDFAAGTEKHDPAAFGMVTPFRGEFRTESLSDFGNSEDAYRQWESPTAGHAYVLEGPDSYAVTMPPAPEVGSAEFAAEIAEVYQMALSRDWPIASFMNRSLVDSVKKTDGTDVSAACLSRLQAGNDRVADVATRITGMNWFLGVATSRDETDPEMRGRRRFGATQTAGTLFRGEGEDGWETPFISQFMVMGTGHPCDFADRDAARASGIITYGAQSIDQRVAIAVPQKDYMTDWENWLDVQNGLNKRQLVGRVRCEEFIPNTRRTTARLRDLATYVHDDQLYQAYLNAALIMLGEGFAFDPSIPYHKNTCNSVRSDNREPFALFGGPHLLTLLTEVSSRALKAVRLQKFSIHRRLRPEAAGALFHTVYSGYQPDRGLDGSKKFAASGASPDALARRQLGRTIAQYTFPANETELGLDPVLEDILTDVRLHNAEQNGTAPDDLNAATWLLPMAFPEGSPMHPAYGAGHATVAGACVTLLKAFFAMIDPKDPTKPVFLIEEDGRALVPDGGTRPVDETIDLLGVSIERGLTLEGELNKLAWNISNARNIAGVHYYTDYIESALLGEAITIGILREQMLAYHPSERVEMTVPLLTPRTLPPSLLNGSAISATEIVAAVRIKSNGTLEAADPTPGRF